MNDYVSCKKPGLQDMSGTMTFANLALPRNCDPPSFLFIQCISFWPAQKMDKQHMKVTSGVSCGRSQSSLSTIVEKGIEFSAVALKEATRPHSLLVHRIVLLPSRNTSRDHFSIWTNSCYLAEVACTWALVCDCIKKESEVGETRFLRVKS